MAVMRALRAITAITAVVTLTAACAVETRVATPAVVPAPPAPLRNTAALDDPADRARFACAVEVQRLQGFDPGSSLQNGSLVGMLIGGAAGAGLGAAFGSINGVAGTGAEVGAIVGGGFGLMAGGLIKLGMDTSAYERGVEACLSVPTTPPAVAPGLVEYRLRVLSLRNDAFASFLSAPELADGVAGPGLARLASTADAGDLERGIVLYDRQIVALDAPVATAFAAVAVDARIKRGGAGRDFWAEARWHGVPGERTVWMITYRNRRPQEVRRVGLSDTTGIAQFRPFRPATFGAKPEATVAVPLSLIDHARSRGTAGALVDRLLDRSRAIAALVGRNDDPVLPDRVYLVVTHATAAATYEAVLGWGERAVERCAVEPRSD